MRYMHSLIQFLVWCISQMSVWPPHSIWHMLIRGHHVEPCVTWLVNAIQSFSRCSSAPEQVANQADRLIEVTKRIRAFGNQGRLKLAIAELSNCVRLGIQPDVQATTSLLSACAGNKKMDLAESVFDDLFGKEFPHSNLISAQEPPVVLPCV